ncbi:MULTISPECIES: T9SS type A sorting domain-containing protein [unclassified Chryseobacterium]|uniref:T9SS-dependent choice-of-anchor J family protein n=1 Tax=unclassified Chryseobacterium TaxID=2593645 RepID=UPI00226A1C1B|nr:MULTISPECIES: T9SS type A sorting domain-containing protein [unclassified Chryseobacterium]
MKRILLSLTLLSSFFGSAQTLLNENFEGTTFPPTGWTRSSTVSTRPWDFTTVNFNAAGQAEYTIAGTKSASVNWTAASNTADLVSPAFSLVGTASPVLRFKAVVGYSYMIAQDAGDLLAQISTDGGTTWTTVWNEDDETGFIDDGDGDEDTDLYNLNIVQVQVSLSAYSTQSNVRVRFRYVAADADIVSIDDVQVLGSVLATNEISKSKSEVSVYPNPTKGEVNIKTDKKVKSSTIVDMTGRSVLKSDTAKADLSALPKGTYLLQVEFADGTKTSEKVIKQ